MHTHTVLARFILPSATLLLDMLMFLKLWDYEGGLSPAVRQHTSAYCCHIAVFQLL
jgi:hypothetical protein